MNKLKQRKALYLDSVKEFASVRTLALCGVMGALAIVLGMVASINIGEYIRIGFSGLPNRVIETLLGPVVGSLFGGTLDILKFVMKPSGPFHFGFTLNAMIAGLIYGSILYQKPLTLPRVFVAEICAKVIVNVILNTFWLTQLYGYAVSAILPARVIKNIIMLPIDTAITFLVLTAVSRIAVQFHFKGTQLQA